MSSGERTGCLSITETCDTNNYRHAQSFLQSFINEPNLSVDVLWRPGDSEDIRQAWGKQMFCWKSTCRLICVFLDQLFAYYWGMCTRLTTDTMNESAALKWRWVRFVIMMSEFCRRHVIRMITMTEGLAETQVYLPFKESGTLSAVVLENEGTRLWSQSV